MRKILITGASGFIGTRLCQKLINAGVDYTVFYGDISIFSNVYKQIEEVSPDVIFHLGGISSVVNCYKDPSRAMSVNFGGVFNLLESFARLKKNVNFIFASTAQVYMAQEGAILDETTKVNASNIYSLTKLLSEDLIRHYYEKNDLGSSLILRIFNHTDKEQEPSYFLPFIYNEIKNIGYGNSGTISVGCLDLWRDFSLVDDLVEVLYSTLEYRNELRVDVVNVCSGTPRLLSNLVNLIAQEVGSIVKFEVDVNKIRAGEPKMIVGCTKKLENLLGYQKEVITDLEFIRKFIGNI